MAKKKAAKPAPAAAPAPRTVLTTRAHYREAVVRLVRRQLELARNGQIGSPEWFLAFRFDGRQIQRFSGWARFDAPWVDIVTHPSGPDPDEDGVEYVWEITEGIEVHAASPYHPARCAVHHIGVDDENPDTLKAVNLLVAHVSQEWLDSLDRPSDAEETSSWMPASYFIPLPRANSESLRKWRDAGKINGTRDGEEGGVRYEVASVLRHLKLPEKALAVLDQKWLEAAIPESGGSATDSSGTQRVSSGNHRNGHPATPARTQHPAHEATKTATPKRNAAQAPRAGAGNRVPTVRD